MEELLEMGVGKYKLGMVNGDIQNGSVAAGQIIGMLREERSVEEIIESVMQEAVGILQNTPKLIR